MKKLYLLLLVLAVIQLTLCDSTMTKWKIEPSLKYDACCFLNILTGDEFYLTYYKEEYDKFKPKLTPEVTEALASLKKKVKEDNGTITSAWLCLYVSAVDDSTLGDMRRTLDNTCTLESNFSKTPCHNDVPWT
jgi:hypothetical protein